MSVFVSIKSLYNVSPVSLVNFQYPLMLKYQVMFLNQLH